MKKYKINVENIPDELKPYIKDEMTSGDLAVFGNALIKNKIEKIKIKLFGWYYDKKIKRQTRKKIKNKI